MIRQGDVFEYDFGPIVDNRQSGRRPALIVQTDHLNSLDGYMLTMVVPLTSKGNGAVPSHVLIEPDSTNGLTRQSFAKCEQIHTVSKLKLGNRLGSVSMNIRYEIRQALKDSLDL